MISASLRSICLGCLLGCLFADRATAAYPLSVENLLAKVHLHATILHLLGLDHARLTYRYAGRDFRLTDVYGNVVKEILA